MKAIMYSLFPKFLQTLSSEQLAAAAAESRFDAVDLVVRDGFWVTPASMAEETEAFVRTMRQRGLRVEFATTGYSPEQLAHDATPLEVMSASGIRSFRMSYFSYNEHEEMFVQLDRARASMERMAGLCARYGVKAVYQVHHGGQMLIPHSLAALYVVRGLPAEQVGIMLDPGNQFREGSENWRRAIASLGPYLAAIGVKDGRYRHNPEERTAPAKGWQPEFAPCQEGVTNWSTIAEALRDTGFGGVFNFQPFYHTAEPERLLKTLKDEAAYIRHTMEMAMEKSVERGEKEWQ